MLFIRNQLFVFLRCQESVRGLAKLQLRACEKTLHQFPGMRV